MLLKNWRVMAAYVLLTWGAFFAASILSGFWLAAVLALCLGSMYSLGMYVRELEITDALDNKQQGN